MTSTNTTKQQETNKKTKIVIIGGGFAGVFTAKNLLKQFNQFQRQTIEIELICERNYFVFQPLLPEVSSGIINPHDAVSPLRILLPNVKHRLASVKNINVENKNIQLLQGRHTKIINLPYDQLIIACGQKSQLNLPGFSDHTFTMKNLGDAFLLRNHILNCLELADVTLDENIKKQTLTFVITGAGFSGVETAGELQDMVQKSLKHYPNIDQDEVQFIILQRDNRILTQLTPSLSDYAHKKLNKRKVDIRLNTGVIQATAKHLITDTGEKIQTHTIITTIGSGPRGFVQRNFELERGCIAVNEYMQTKQYADIWALGDVAIIPMDEQKTGMKYAPPTAQFAVAEAKIIAKNIQANLYNKPKQAFNFNPLGLMASLGAYQGVIEIGKVRLSGFLAWAMWRGIYIVKLPGFVTQLRITLNWLLDFIFPRTMVQVSPVMEKTFKKALFSQGDVIYREGDLIAHAAIVIKGSVECKNTDGIHTLGEQAVIHSCIDNYHSSHTHTITALEEVSLLLMPLDEFLLLKQNFKAFDTLCQNFKYNS